MKTIGLLGGMSWESTVTYYETVNQEVRDRLGKHHSAEVLLRSLDFEAVRAFQRAKDWKGAARHLIQGVRQLEDGGADLALICTNTMHILFDEIAEAVSLPLLHIADVTAAAIRREGIQRVGLLGTRFTMEESFYRERLERSAGEGGAPPLAVLVPEEEDRGEVHRVIFEELCLGTVYPESRERFLEIIERLRSQGAEGVILGCTEIPLLIGQGDVELPLFDTTSLHSIAAVDAALL
ncbi:aspartate/glutamate racemase family protein [bacterium]|nr:aspartate/glutamate racemase family protein [bacterium]